jgi:hypothetical protein
MEEVVLRTLTSILAAALLTGGCVLSSSEPTSVLETSALPTSTTTPDNAAKSAVPPPKDAKNAVPAPKQANTTPNPTAKPDWVRDRAAWCRRRAQEKLARRSPDDPVGGTSDPYLIAVHDELCRAQQ